MNREELVELPDMIRVHRWFEEHKLDLTCRISTDSLPDTVDVRVTGEVCCGSLTSDESQWVLIMNFCVALRGGTV